ncbi:MAG: relaxase/mobilization nuclease domain-containing protein [Ruminococcus sp.]|nr:relaxase/mobilization nuclease domain-containing protein [Ruminococcus sp.]
MNGLYVNSYACRADSAGASEDFRAVRQQGTGRTQILAYHMIQSFAPDEVTPEQAMQIGEELCDRYLKGDYQYVIAVHTDKEHTHCHVIFNNTNLYNGLSFTTEHNQGRKSERAWAELRQISDEICKEYGISVIEPIGKGVSHYEDEMQKAGTSWKDKLRRMLREIISYSKSFEEFLKNCTDSGIEYVYTPQNKVKLKFKLSGEGQQRFTRADTLSEEFEPENIKATIDTAQKKAAAAEQVEKFFAARRARRQAELALLNQSSAKPAEPKPTSTPTVQPKPTIAEQTAPKPIESKAPEKKEDVWAAIRGMRDSDKMIADLEAGGITSLDDLRSFFWNTHHDDDHTDELAKLNTKIMGIEKLLAMMKQRSQHSATYKEYQERSAFTQKGFRKKNAAAIDSYEQADKYIKEHIKHYLVDGKAPKRSELEQRLIELKSEYNALVPEHNAFIRRQNAASQYTRQVRTYLEKQHQQERDRQYQERKRTQQKKKDALE